MLFFVANCHGLSGLTAKEQDNRGGATAFYWVLRRPLAQIRLPLPDK